MDTLTLFLAGDVMTGRGIDQILPHPVDPVLHESFVRSARDYVELAERAGGRLPANVDYGYVWGDAIDELSRVAPDVRAINLETSITRSEDFSPGKSVHYRMSPDNAACLTAAGINLCALANNHVLDWGHRGLEETLATLERSDIGYAGAGRNLEHAREPAVVEVPGKGRVIFISVGSPTSGIPLGWVASRDRPGLDLVPDFSEDEVVSIRQRVEAVKQPGDVVVVSVHWGPNWGYRVPAVEVSFAHALIDRAGVDLVHGHSSHHVKAIEMYRGRLVLYGCGDFISDYEGISGYEEFRGDLGLMYFPSLDPDTGELVGMRMTPTRVRQLRVTRANGADADRLLSTLNEQGARFRTGVVPSGGGTFELQAR